MIKLNNDSLAILDKDGLNELLIEVLKKKVVFWESGADMIDGYYHFYSKMTNDEIYNLLDEQQVQIENAITKWKND